MLNKIGKGVTLFCKIFIVAGILSYFFIGGYIAHVYFKYRDTKIVTINEGLGNQLYQYAFGYIFHKRTGKKVLFLDGINHYDERSWVKFWLNYFDIKIDMFQPSEFERSIIKKFFIKKNSFVDLNQYSFEEILQEEQIKGFKHYKINFVNAKYFHGYEQDIIKIFTTLNPKYANELDDRNKKLITEMQSHKNSVVINIRLGDFLRYPDLNICNFDYYKKAMNVFDKMEDVHYYVFSDDIEGAKKYFKTNKPTTYVDINPLEKPYLNLILSASAKHNIVSNSSFAVWAGLLNNNPDKIVVCPSEYIRAFPEQGKMYKSALMWQKQSKYNYPDNWIKIDTTKDKPIDINNIETKFTKDVVNELTDTIPQWAKSRTKKSGK